jgi:hypothetical protein
LLSLGGRPKTDADGTLSDARERTMKLTLTLDAAPAGVRAGLAEEWEEIGGPVRMEPMVRLFDSDEQAIAWGRAMARRRRLSQIYLTDNRSAARS